MWKPASQLQCWARFTWAQRGLRLNAGSFITLHSGGAALGEKMWKLKICAVHVVNMYSSWSQLQIQTNKRISDIKFAILTCLGLVLAVRATPVLWAGAFVLVNTFHTGTSILAGITCTLTYICGCRRGWSLWSTGWEISSTDWCIQNKKTSVGAWYRFENKLYTVEQFNSDSETLKNFNHQQPYLSNSMRESDGKNRSCVKHFWKNVKKVNYNRMCLRFHWKAEECNTQGQKYRTIFSLCKPFLSTIHP